MIEFLKLEIVKPFAMLLAIIIGLLVLEYGFHMKLTEGGFVDGKFTAKVQREVEKKAWDAGNTLIGISTDLEEMKKKVAELTAKMPGATPPPTPISFDSPGSTEKANLPASDGIQTNDALAGLFKSVSGKVSPLAGKEGYVFIGNKQSGTQNLQPTWIGQVSGAQVASIDLLQTNQPYTVLANLVLRKGKPGNDAAYFKGQESLGVLPNPSYSNA